MDTEWKRRDVTSCSSDGDGRSGLQAVQVQDGRIVAARRGIEAVGEAGHEHLARRFIGPDLHLAAPQQKIGSQLVDAMGVVGMFMGKEYGVDIRY